MIVSAIRNIRWGVFLSLLASALILAACKPPPPPPPTPSPAASSTTESAAPSTPPPAPSPSLSGALPDTRRTSAAVTRVIDGDTIEVSIGGRTMTVRYIGIDTPETVAPGQSVGCYGPEASARNKALVDGKTVELEQDVSETDRFGRLLRYVYVGDEMVNEVLVLGGYAQVSTFPPDVRNADRFLAAQQVAQDADRGLWGACLAPTPAPSPTSSDCDPSYPTVCIPPPPPDLDCPDIPYRRFQVLPPDPHRFDGSDKDGVGCESD